MKALFILFTLLLPFFSTGQVNLVQNPSFEDTFNCPADTSIIRATNWFTPDCGTPDFYYPTMSGSTLCSNQYPAYWGGGGYSNNYGYATPNSGVAYTGMLVSQGGELMAGKLSDSLRSGKTYAISFYASLSELYFNSGGEGMDLIGFCLMRDSITDYNINTCWMYLGTLQADAGNQPGNFLTDTSGWMLVQDTFVAQGGERYFVLGNIDTANTQYVNSASPTPCYYYFDDFDVHCIDCTSDTSEPPAYPEISLTPSLTSGQITLSGNFPEGTQFEIYNMLGQRIYYAELQSGNHAQNLFLSLADGTYIYRVQVEGVTLKSDRIVLQH